MKDKDLVENINSFWNSRVELIEENGPENLMKRCHIDLDKEVENILDSEKAFVSKQEKLDEMKKNPWSLQAMESQPLSKLKKS